MNAQQIYDLMLDGAYHKDDQLVHPSFRKGYRKLSFTNVSFISAYRRLLREKRIISTDGIIKAN